VQFGPSAGTGARGLEGRSAIHYDKDCIYYCTGHMIAEKGWGGSPLKLLSFFCTFTAVEGVLVLVVISLQRIGIVFLELRYRFCLGVMWKPDHVHSEFFLVGSV
jgi:hypothetical protein